MILNKLHLEENDFQSVTSEDLIKQVDKIVLDDKTYQFKYSNFGIAVLGETIAQYLEDDYSSIMDEYISSELKLPNTRISDGLGNLDGCWKWEKGDAYIPAGGVISTLPDMMEYLSIHMTDKLPYLEYGHKAIEQINSSNSYYEKMGISMDAVGIGWLIDEDNNIIWHNGGTSNYNSYIGFDKDKQIGIVILSNLPPSYRLPSTVMGVKLITELQNQID